MAVVVALVIAFIAWGLGQLLPKSPTDGSPKGTQAAGLGSGATPAVETPAASPITENARPQPVDLTRIDSTTAAGSGSRSASDIGSGAIPASNSPLPPQPAMGAADAAPVVDTAQAKLRAMIEEGEKALRDGKTLEARQKLNEALRSPDAGDSDRTSLREKLAAINADLVFSPKIAPGDQLVEEYVVQEGDSYERIRKRQQLAVDWRLLERVNRTPPNRLRVGQKLKLVRGPFNVVVSKTDYRLDIFAGSPDDQSSWLYIRSFNVGLGENDGTPIGTFKVKTGGKAVDPPWTNPRTGEHFDAKDPKNPIGDYWIGIQGLGSASAYTGYGIHGTVEPASIGQQRSMGCVRLVNEDVAQVYELLVEEISVVKIER